LQLNINHSAAFNQWLCSCTYGRAHGLYYVKTAPFKNDYRIQGCLIDKKCMPSLLCGLDARPVVKSELASLDFVVNTFLMKMIGTSSLCVNPALVSACRVYWGRIV